MSDDLRVNGNQVSWGSLTVKVIDGTRLFGFTAISFADSRERVKAYGMGRAQAPRGRSRGKYATEPVGLTGWKTSIQALRKALADAGDGVSYGDVVFQIVVQYVEGDEDPITVEIEDCVFVKNTTSDEEGSDPLKDEIEIDCMRIIRNGLVLYDASEGL